MNRIDAPHLHPEKFRVDSLLPFPNKAVAVSIATVATVATMTFLYLTYSGPTFSLIFFLLFNAAFFIAASAFRAGFECRAFGVASLAAPCIAFASFFITALVIKREPLGPDPVGANSMTNLFALVVFPFMFAPIALPAVPCWIASATFEKWPVVWYVLVGIITLLAAIMNWLIIPFLISKPTLIHDLFG